MPQRKSERKELRKIKVRSRRNLKAKNQVKSTVKQFKKSLTTKDAAALKQDLQEAYKTLDKAAAKGIIHANKAARKKSRLALLLNSNSTKAKPDKKAKASPAKAQ